MLQFKSGGVSVYVKCSEHLVHLLKGSEFLPSHIPDVLVLDEEFKSGEFVLEIIYDCQVRFSFAKNRASLYGDIDSNLSIEDVITVIDYCLEYLRQLQGIYCVHGSAVSSHGLGILIFGGLSGLGKTTLALHLCKNKNYNLIGDEKLLLKGDYLLGGIKKVTFNKQWLFESSSLEIAEQIQREEKAVKISLIIQPGIAGVSCGLEKEKWSEIKANFHFYEELSKTIRGVSRRISNFTYPLVSLDNQEIAVGRSQYAKYLSSKVPFYSIRGNVEEAIDFIDELLSKS